MFNDGLPYAVLARTKNELVWFKDELIKKNLLQSGLTEEGVEQGIAAAL